MDWLSRRIESRAGREPPNVRRAWRLESTQTACGYPRTSENGNRAFWRFYAHVPMLRTRFTIVADTSNATAPPEVILRELVKVMEERYRARCVRCRLDGTARLKLGDDRAYHRPINLRRDEGP